MAINRSIFTGMENANWQSGLKWVRFVKQVGVSVVVINMGLEEENVEKLKELGVIVLPNTKKSGIAQVDVFNSLLAHAETNPARYLFWDITTQAENVTSLWGIQTFGAAKMPDTNITSLVFPLTSIDVRVRLSDRLEREVVEEYGSALYGGLMCGTVDGWKMFSGFYNNLIETGVVESLIPARNLVLNLFAIYFKEWVEAKPVYQIVTLQPEKLE